MTENVNSRNRQKPEQSNAVLQSLETPDGGLCVDIFIRPDGSYGFEQYRRDAEDGRGWFPIGFHGDASFASEGEALDAAVRAVPWLKGVLEEIAGPRRGAQRS